MKVFVNKSSSSYYHDMILVAANSKEEAHGVVCFKESEIQGKYQTKDWEELKDVVANVETPVVLSESGDTE